MIPSWVIRQSLESRTRPESNGYCIHLYNYLSCFAAIAFVWPVNQSRNASILLDPSRTTTLLWPTGVCSSSQVVDAGEQPTRPKIYLLVIVCSAVQNFEERQVIRDTWAKDQLALSNVKVIFLLGQLKNATFQSNVTTESESYGDILQEGFIDTYANLTVKSLMLLKWFTKECDKVPYILKTDDDMYINLKQLFQLVSFFYIPLFKYVVPLFFFCSAFLRDFSLWLDRLSGDYSDTWHGPAM